MSRKAPNKRGSPAKITVIISGMSSVGKTTAAESISKRFKIPHFGGGDMLKEIALERGYSPSGADWWDTKEGMRFLQERKRFADFDKEVDLRLIKKVNEGGVVVTSYPLPWICKKGLKIWFEASKKTRASRLAGRDGISVSTALKIIDKRDKENWELYRNIYSIDFGRDLSVFNYTLDTERLSAKRVEELSVELVQKSFNSAKVLR